jgi:ribosome modulation factor
MKRVKREKSSRAFSKGYHHGVQGHSRSYCPYNDEESRLNWISGWRQGRSDLWSGFGHVPTMKRALVV